MKPSLLALAFNSAAMAMRLPDPNFNLAKRDTCANAIDNKPRYDCDKPAGHKLNPDGSCGDPNLFDPDVSECSIYCEVKRTGFLGPQQTAPGPFDRIEGPGNSISLTSGTSTTITYGFSIGGSKMWENAISAGVTFDFSIAKTTIMSVTQSAPARPAPYNSQWIFGPMLTETCGSVSQADYFPGEDGGDGAAASGPACFIDDVVTTGNVCSVSPTLDSDGNPRDV
ncbi:hypothetical protein CHU98_g3289 [Xylaria longipes]|nr:hypothetical protein CHU98_g3289 [Xylaria longipes]